MNTYTTHSLVQDHIRESRQQAVAARRASAAHVSRRRSGNREARPSAHRNERGA